LLATHIKPAIARRFLWPHDACIAWIAVFGAK
jgi:hypothetical protein